MKRQLFKAAVPQNIQNNQETQTAEYDQKTCGQIQQYVILVGNQVCKISQNVKAGVIKGGNGMVITDSKGA